MPIAQLAAWLNSAGKITLLCGSGCAGAHAQLLALADALKAPIVHAMRGKEHVEWDNPYDVGMTGLIGFSSGYRAMEILRHAADAGHRLSRIGSSIRTSAQHRADRSARREHRPPRAGRSRPGRRCRRDAGCAAAAPDAEDRPRASGRVGRALSRGAQGPGRTGDRAEGRRAASAAHRARAERAGRRRCHLHLRRRAADGLGGALPGDERPAAADRLVLARLDGQRDGAGDRRAGGVPGAAGGLAVRRRRLHHADGRPAEPAGSSSCRRRSSSSTTARWASSSWSRSLPGSSIPEPSWKIRTSR